MWEYLKVLTVRNANFILKYLSFLRCYTQIKKVIRYSKIIEKDEDIFLINYYIFNELIFK